jgi:hypothetical protein
VQAKAEGDRQPLDVFPKKVYTMKMKVEVLESFPDSSITDQNHFEGASILERRRKRQ